MRHWGDCSCHYRTSGRTSRHEPVRMIDRLRNKVTLFLSFSLSLRERERALFLSHATSSGLRFLYSGGAPLRKPGIKKMRLAPAACGAKKKAGGWRARGGVHKSDCKIAFLARFFSKFSPAAPTNLGSLRSPGDTLTGFLATSSKCIIYWEHDPL